MKRTLLAAVMVCAVLFMVGCGANAEQKAAIKTQGDQIVTMQKALTDLSKTVGDLKTSNDSIVAFLGRKLNYGVAPVAKTTGKNTPGTTTPPTNKAPAGGTAPAKSTTPGKTK